MALTLELSDEKVAQLKAKAAAEGLTLEGWLERLAGLEADGEAKPKPLKSARGIVAKYGPAPSAEEIDENRREMLRNFPREVE